MSYSGFFQFENKEDGVYLKAVAKDMSNMPPIDCLAAYCDKKSIPYADKFSLKKAAESAMRGEPARVSDVQLTAFSGFAEYSFGEEGMEFFVTIYPPMSGMPDISLEEMEGDFVHHRVTYGVNKEAVQKLISSKNYYERTLVAVGTPPIEGCDAELTYAFNTEVSTKPRINEDGTVDFHQLDLINKISEGDVVARIRPEDHGTPGTNIFGEPIKPKKVYKKSFKYGKNLKISEDGLELISMITGHVYLEGDKIFVSGEYDIKADVDNSTGDIDYDGNVRIRGTVRAGFKVKASGNVVVDGMVEGAQVTAGGDIILQRGIHGMNKGVLTAGGNIAANFIENATARAGKDIETDAILHSKVSAHGNILVDGRNGMMVGGSIRAGNTIQAKIIGSQMETATEVGVGNDPEVVARVRELKKQITKAGQDKEMLNQMLTLLRKKREAEGSLNEEKTELLQKTMKNVILLESSLKEMRAEYAELNEKISETDDARIKITRTIYPGVKLEIYDSVYFIRDKNDYCQYVRKEGEIKRINL
ncbi:MAG: FapA family protein [Butyrivibrio sp.]|nr:FapA family protein [Butyrivibrio sp.]